MTPHEEVRLRCPTCRHEWVAAWIIPTAWWGHVRPAEIATRPYCPACDAPPPMQVCDRAPLFALMEEEPR